MAEKLLPATGGAEIVYSAGVRVPVFGCERVDGHATHGVTHEAFRVRKPAVAVLGRGMRHGHGVGHHNEAASRPFINEGHAAQGIELDQRERSATLSRILQLPSFKETRP